MLQRLIPRGVRVLELGCGHGDVLAALDPGVGVGVDVSPKMIAEARRRHPGLRFEVGDAERLDLDGETFDYVVLCDLVGELHDVWAALRSLRRVCSPRTRLVITYSNFLWEPALRLATRLGVRRAQYLQNWFATADILNLLHLNGFEAVMTGDRLSLPFQVPVVAEIANHVVGSLPFVHHLNLIEYVVARPAPSFDVVADNLSTSVVVPAKNERGNIRQIIRRVPRMGPRTELIFVEGGSSDGTRAEIEAAMLDEPSPCVLSCVPQHGKGKGDAVRAGFATATGDILMILDADLTVAAEDLPRFYLAIAERRADFVNGCRLIYPLEDQAMRFLNRHANKTFSILLSYALSQKVKDTLCGTKVLRRHDYQRIVENRTMFGDFDPFGDFDLLFGAAHLGLRIAEMPVRYFARTYGETQIDRFRHGLLLLRMFGVATKHFKLSRSSRRRG